MLPNLTLETFFRYVGWFLQLAVPTVTTSGTRRDDEVRHAGAHGLQVLDHAGSSWSAMQHSAPFVTSPDRAGGEPLHQEGGQMHGRLCLLLRHRHGVGPSVPVRLALPEQLCH